jgi:hypothetical protein
MTAITFITLTVVEGLFVGVSLTLDQGLRSTGVAVRGLPTLLDEGVRKVRKELVPTLITNYKVWPLAQILNFAVVPIKLQVPCPPPVVAPTILRTPPPSKFESRPRLRFLAPSAPRFAPSKVRPARSATVRRVASATQRLNNGIQNT